MIGLLTALQNGKSQILEVTDWMPLIEEQALGYFGFRFKSFNYVEFNNILILESDSSMEQKITDPNSLDPPDNNHQTLEKHEVPQWNCFQSSNILRPRQIYTETFGTINSFYTREYQPRDLNNLSAITFLQRQTDNFGYFEEESPFQVITFNRGISEPCEPYQAVETKDNQAAAVELPSLMERRQQSHKGHQQNLIASPLSSDLSGQEFKSNSINSHSLIDLQSKETLAPQARGILAKNVTKNIGKLLMKFIWKNRCSLKQQLKVGQGIWDNFLSCLKTWKRENNITRQFLVIRWQGERQEFRIFRTISRHFFRKHCLAAVFKSHIRLKRIHFQHIVKFNEAVTNPKALDCLV